MDVYIDESMFTTIGNNIAVKSTIVYAYRAVFITIPTVCTVGKLPDRLVMCGKVLSCE